MRKNIIFYKKGLIIQMVKYYFKSNGVRSEVTEDTFNKVKEYYDVNNISATGDGNDYEEITLSVEESDMPF